MPSVLLDTGVIVALFNNKDKHHHKSVQFIKNNRHPLVTTIANVTECIFLYNNQAQTQANILNWLHLAKVQIATLTTDDLTEIAMLMMQYSDVPMDFADGALLHLANSRNINQVATIDSDFYIYKIDGRYPFKMLV